MSVLHQDSGWIGKSIPSALEISLGHGFCTPRPSGFPSGFALGKSLGSRGAKPMTAGNLSRFPSTLEISLGLRPREISRVSGNLGRRGWISQSIPRLGGARIQWKFIPFLVPAIQVWIWWRRRRCRWLPQQFDSQAVRGFFGFDRLWSFLWVLEFRNVDQKEIKNCKT